MAGRQRIYGVELCCVRPDGFCSLSDNDNEFTEHDITHYPCDYLSHHQPEMKELQHNCASQKS